MGIAHAQISYAINVLGCARVIQRDEINRSEKGGERENKRKKGNEVSGRKGKKKQEGEENRMEEKGKKKEKEKKKWRKRETERWGTGKDGGRKKRRMMRLICFAGIFQLQMTQASVQPKMDITSEIPSAEINCRPNKSKENLSRKHHGRYSREKIHFRITIKQDRD